MGLPSVIAGILVVYGGGLAAATLDYSLFVVAFAAATLIALPRPRRADPVTEMCGH